MGDAPLLESLSAVARAVGPRAGATSVIAIDGRSGAGKSTLAGELALAIDAPIVALEDLYGGWDGLEAGVGRLVAAVLRPIATGRDAHVPRYDWDADAWSEPWLLRVPPRLIVEGVGAGALAVAPFTSLLVWLELPAAVRRGRLLRRDGGDYDRQQESWAVQEDDFFGRERPFERADLVLEAGLLLQNGGDQSGSEELEANREALGPT